MRFEAKIFGIAVAIEKNFNEEYRLLSLLPKGSHKTPFSSQNLFTVSRYSFINLIRL
jgi:hypothetical protein